MEDESGAAPPARRPVRPNFAEDVYGTGSQEGGNKPSDSAGSSSVTVSTPGGGTGELSESSLAQRRSAVLLKLKDIRGGDTQKPMDNDNMHDPCDLEFAYADCDDLRAELSELYAYSEMEEFGINAQSYRDYADSKGVTASFTDLCRSHQISLLSDLSSRLESAESDVRLTSARTILYILQGAFLDFDEDDDIDMAVGERKVSDATEHKFPDRGTGNHEEECIRRAVRYAYLAAEAGVYQALCTMFMREIDEPFDVGLPIDGRESKASSIHSAGRNSSTADLAENERRARRSATTADNEAMRVVLSCIYHMVECIRRDTLLDTVADSTGAKEHLLRVRKQFIEELEEPLEYCEHPLVIILCNMMTPFYNGSSPHYPVKKVFLLTWKIILVSLGGWDVLKNEKKQKRDNFGLSSVEDTLVVAEQMKACTISDGDGVYGGARGGVRRHTTSRMMLGRQMACSGSEESADEQSAPSGGEESDDSGVDEGSVAASPTNPSNNTEGNEVERAGTPAPFKTESQSQEDGGERTPTAGSPVPQRKAEKLLPWKSKVRAEEIEAFLQQERQKFFGYDLPGDTTTMFGLPPPILASMDVLRRHTYVSMSELEMQKEEDLNRYLFSMKEDIEVTKVERLYRQLLPTLANYVIALLKVMLAAAPSSKAKSETVNILCDLLTPETDCSDVLSSSISLDKSTSNPLEDSVRLAIDINRHKEIVVKAVSAIMLLLLKHFKLNHVHQFEAFGQHLIYGNGIPLILKFLDQNMSRYIQSRHELHPYNYPQCALHWARNREEWPTLSADNVEACGAPMTNEGGYRLWRNVFSSVNMVRIMNKLTKWKHARTMMLVVFKSAPILKRCLKIRVALFQLYTLKLLKMQARYLGRQWRRSNMDIISAIYCTVRHRLADDWAFANDTRSKSWDFQADEHALKGQIERFHSRRYGKLHPTFAVESSETPLPGDNYLNNIDSRQYDPVDNCAISLLGRQPELGERFKKNYTNWMEKEVIRRKIDWDRVLMDFKGVMVEQQ